MADVSEKMIEAAHAALEEHWEIRVPSDEVLAAIYTAMHSAREVDGETVERVALAMAKEIGWGTFSHFNPDDMRRLARAAAIAAMGEGDVR